MNANDPPEGSLAPNDLGKTRVIENDPGSGTPLHRGGAGRWPRCPPVIPDHELVRVIGKGAYGEVWLARNIMGTYRAVKVVYRDSFESDRPYEREFSGIQSFEPISRAHESQLDILHVGRNEAQGCFFYVMELADDVKTGRQILPDTYEAKTIRSELKRRGRFSFAESLEICLALTTAAEHLHKHGLIHRDIKPANVIFLNGLAKLADIGLVTETGGTMSFVGTEGYLPPEGPGSVQADIYSLGKTLYEVATGKDRFEFPELPTLTGSPSEESQLFELNEVLLKACHPDRDGRYRHASEMHADLVLLQAGKSIRRSRALEQRLALLTKIAAGVLLVASLAAGAYVYQQFQTREALRLAQAETFQRTRAEGLLKTVQSKQAENEHLLTTLQLKQAENFFENDDAGKGVAYLARMLRQNPSNHLAAARLMSALNDRSFALPVRTFEFPKSTWSKHFSPDGLRFLAWAQNDTNGEVWLLEVATGEINKKPLRHEKAVSMSTFSPNSRWVATASADGKVRIWDAATAEPASVPLSHEGEVSDIAFSPDSQRLVVVSGTKAHVWSVPAGEPVMAPIQGDSAFLWTAEFSPDGGRILTSTRDNRLDLWDARTGSHFMNLKVEGGNATGNVAPRFSPDGSYIAAALGAEVVVWDAQTGKLRHRMHYEGGVTAFQFSPDGLRIVAGDQQRRVRVWDVRTGQPLILPIILHMEVWGVKFDSTGERILTQAAGRVRVWDSRTGQPVTEWLENSWGAHFTPTGPNVVAYSDDNAILYEVRPGQALNLTLRHRSSVNPANFSASGGKVVTTADNEVVIWDATTGDLAAPRIKIPAGVRQAKISPDERSLVTVSPNGQARIWDARTSTPLTEPLRHEAPVESAQYSLDGRMIVTGSMDKTARVWDAQTGRPLTDPLPQAGAVQSVEFSPDGRRILVVSSEPTVQGTTMTSARIWDITIGAFTELTSRGERITDAHFSPDGKRVVAAFIEKKALVWDSGTGRVICGPLQHQSMMWSARFSPDGRRIITASSDQTARIWDAGTGKLVGEPLSHEALVDLALFSPDSRRVITVSDVGQIARVWDAETGRPLTEALRHADWAHHGEFSPDGRRLVTASRDGTARIWELPPADVPMPDWMLDLAEAVTGNRLLDQEMADEVRAKQFLALKQQILASPATDRYTAWAKWFVSDRLERATSLNSRITGNDHLARLVEWSSVRTLREALLLSPANAEATARLAREILAKSPKEYPHKEQVAAFLTERAVKLNPEEPQAWWAKAELLEHAGRQEEALQTLERARALAPDSLEMWQLKAQWLEKAGQDEAALQAYAKAVALVEPSRETPDSQSEMAEARKTVLLKRAAVFARLGRLKESVDDNLRARGIPSRASEATPERIDLSLHYNAGLTESWHQGLAQNDLASLPRGLQTLAGVRWDLRGLIQLGRESPSGEPYPKRVSGISVGLACQRIHFLHAAISTEGLQKVEIGKYVVHFADGRAIEIPVVVERDLNNWWSQGGEQGKPLIIAWTGTNAAAAEHNSTIRLFRSTWENPTPEAAVQSIELVSTHDRGAPFLVAITAQTEPTPQILRQPQSQTIDAGTRAVFEVEAESQAPRRYQWRLNGSDITGATNRSHVIPTVLPKDAGTYTMQVWNAIENSVLALTSEPASLVVKTADLIFGVLRREVYTNISGSKLTNLTACARFPDSPDTMDLVHQFETPSNFAENYGVRLRGFLAPPKSGPYRFYLSSDDESALFLSTDESPERKRQIAHEPEWNGERMWTATKSRPKRDNVSAPIHLEAGRQYYLEALMKEGQGGDNLAVTWQMPGEPPPENFSPPIPGTYLAVPAKWTKALATPLVSD